MYERMLNKGMKPTMQNNSGSCWECKNEDFSYRRHQVFWHTYGECALWQKYSHRNWLAVRYPFVLGKDDYTKRLLYYVEHTMKSIPMNIDNLDYQMGYIHSEDAGKFMAFLADKDVRGAINECSEGTISLREIIKYVEKKTGTKAIIDKTGENAPYNGEPEYSINTERAKALGFLFSALQDWIYELLDYYIQSVV